MQKSFGKGFDEEQTASRGGSAGLGWWDQVAQAMGFCQESSDEIAKRGKVLD